MSDLPKGFTCECGKEHLFGVYVHAHWSEKLTHTCDRCDRRHSVLRGMVHLVGNPKKPAKDPTHD